LEYSLFKRGKGYERGRSPLSLFNSPLQPIKIRVIDYNRLERGKG
jgi:hypothetical protein